ncbi:hypothetical protein C3L33_23102, partial [Rhododendron williamsianum]
MSTTVTISPALAFLVSNFPALVAIKLDAGNLLLWQTQVCNALRPIGFLVDNPAFFMWKVIDGQLLRCITASLSVSILPLVLGLEYSMDKSNRSSQSGPTQRASALAALSSAFNPSSGSKSDGTPRSSGTSQGPQRAAALTALSQVPTAEKKQSLESSPARSTRSPPSEGSTPVEVLLAAGTNSENALSEVEKSKEDSKVNDLADETVLESNGNDSGGSPIEVVLPQEFESLQNSVFQIIKASRAIITDTRHVILKLHGFKTLKKLLQKKKVGLAIRSQWLEIDNGKIRIKIYPKGDNKARSHISFFFQKLKDPYSFHGTCYISYTLSIGDGQCILKCAKGRFVDNEAEMGWSEFVNLGVIMERKAGFLVDDSIAFNADVRILNEIFFVGIEEIRWHNFKVEESVEGMPIIWCMFNLASFFDVLSTEGIVSPSFQFGKFVIQMVILIEREYFAVRLECNGTNLAVSDKNCQIICTMLLMVSANQDPEPDVYTMSKSCTVCPTFENEDKAVFIKASDFPREGEFSFQFRLQSVNIREENAQCYEDDKFKTSLRNVDPNPNEHQLHAEADNIVSDVCESKEERQAKFADSDGEKASWMSQRELDREHFAGENKRLQERLNKAESQLQKFHSLPEEIEKLSKKNRQNEDYIAILKIEKSETDDKLQKAEDLTVTISEKLKAEKSVGKLKEEEAEQLHKKVGGLEKELECMIQKNTGLEKELECMIQKNTGLEKELECMIQKNTGLEKELECMLQKNTELIDEKDAISSTCELLLDSLKDARVTLHQYIQYLHAALETLVQRVQRLENDLLTHASCLAATYMVLVLRLLSGV